MESHRKREQRIVARCRVEFERLDRMIRAESEDLSKHGIFVRTDELLPAGAVTELAVTLPDGNHLRLISRVAHLLSPSAARALGRRAGMGFEFLEQESEGYEHLAGYLDELMEELTPTPITMPPVMRVMIADPSPPLLHRLTTAMDGKGFVLETFTTGSDVYAACAERPPDAIVADAALPGVDGWTLVKMITSRPRLAAVPIILMSDDASDMTRLQAYRLGVFDFLHKPFTEEELVLRLRRLAASEPREADRVMLRGNLMEISVATLLSMFEFERKSGILVVLSNAAVARLFVANGRVVKIEHGADVERPPRQQVMDVLDWIGGNFEFTACEVVGGDDIGLPTSSLLLEHARLRDEARTTPPES